MRIWVVICSKVLICIDNDEVGNKFYVKVKYKSIKIERIVLKLKDWNDDLCKLKLEKIR